MAFELPKLDYAYDGLEPHYDEATLRIHHSKHHQAYTDKLNGAVEAAGLEGKSIEELLQNLDQVPEAQRTAVINHGGGYYNHAFFWKNMSPNGGGQPTGDVATAITNTFGSFDAFKAAFADKATGQFGSGWAWLVVDNNDNALKVTNTHDQICPLSLGQTPLLTLDVWEHAYYLKFQNRRAEWIDTFWNLVDWAQVEARYQARKKAAVAA